MRLHILSDLHLETEDFSPEPAPGADLLVLGGDIDSTWAGLERFRDWPVPVLFIAGNHEFDRRELSTAWPQLRARCAAVGIRMLEQETLILKCPHSGARIRLVATTRWCDFDLLGEDKREKAMRAAKYYFDLMGSTQGGLPWDVPQVRDEALRCRAWLEGELRRGQKAAGTEWDKTVVITHFAPSALSADPRYGVSPATASFCNADDDLIPRADLWIHGHLHCRHDYCVGGTRVVSNARGHSSKGEAEGFDPLRVVEV